jgi:nucleotide-binding universal stress UspA family protein
MIPPRRILVGVDFSEASRAALDLAARLAVQTGATLAVLHVLDPMLTAAAREAHVDLASESADELRRFVAATPPADTIATNPLVVGGSTGSVLCDLAVREQADLLVVGAHGMGAASRWLFGSNTERVMRHARMSVLIVPPGWRSPHPQARDLSGLGPVIAAVDFTEAAFTAAHAAARLAHTLGTQLTVVHVVPELRVPERWTSHARGAVEHATRAARLDLEARLSPLKQVVPVHLDVIAGDVASSIVRATELPEPSFPLLVLGRRPRGADESAPGTVVSRAVAALQVPLLIVPPSDALG